MIPIKVDFSGLQQEFNFTEKECTNLLSYVIYNLTIKAADRWKMIASHELHKTRDLYVNSLIIGDEGPYTGYVELINQLPLMIETGADAFDMKRGFAKSEKVKIKKDGGWYLSIPFRYSSSSSLGENQIFAGKLPKFVEREVKKLPINTPLKGLGGKIPQQYIGLKKTKLPGSSRHTQYINFRRVSDKSSDESWIHLGFVAKNFKEKTIQGMNLFQEVDELIELYLESLGF